MSTPKPFSVLLILCSLFTQFVSGQSNLVPDSTIATRDSIVDYFNNVKAKYKCDLKAKDFKVISEDALRTMLRRDFSFLVLNRDQSQLAAGTAFTMDFNTDKTVVTYNIAFLNGSEKKYRNSLMEMPRAKWIFSASIQGGFSNSIGTVLSNSKANSKGALTVKVSRLISGLTGPKNRKDYCEAVVDATKAHIEVLKTQGYLELLNYKNLNALIATKQAELNVIEAQISAVPETQTGKLVSLLEKKKVIQESITALKKSAVLEQPYALNVIRKLNDSLVAYELKNVKWNKQTVTWWDVQYGVNVGSYNIFDDVSTHTNTTKTLQQASFGFSWNQVQNWKKYLFYYKIGYRNVVTNNLEGATSYTLEQSDIYSSGTNQQKIGKSINAYKISETGAFQKYKQHVFEGDGIFLFAKNTLGVHGFFDLGFNYDTDLYTKTGVLNGGIGLIFTVFDQAKDKAKVNIEPFFKLKDINSQTKLSESYSTWERYTVGIKVGLPFNRILL